jgi:outer membrane protein OmpA-like peptidoglycan-associated protein
LGSALLVGLTFTVYRTVRSAEQRLAQPAIAAEPSGVAVADHAEASYCTPQFKEVLERVLHSCGLETGESRRGCKPSDVKTFAAISDEDFNALFRPLQDRGGVVLYDTNKHDLDDAAKQLVADRFGERRGARYFLVVGRASPIGGTEKNRALSHRRANSVLFHLKETTQDPELDKQVGTLWLGSEFAQLQEEEFCKWPTSRPGGKCDDRFVNQSAFISWVDCRL